MEELLIIEANLRENEGKIRLTDEKGEPIVYDQEKSLFITDVVIQKDGTVCAVVPLGYFSNETIEFIEKLTSARKSNP